MSLKYMNYKTKIMLKKVPMLVPFPAVRAHEPGKGNSTRYVVCPESS